MAHHMTRRTFGTFALSTAATAASGAVAAGSLPAPAGRTILTVSGRIGVFNEGEAALFDLAMLEALGTDRFMTSTPWYGGQVLFEGVRMQRLMQAVGAAGQTVTAVALNDYVTELPIADFEAYGTLLALKRDGNYMPVRDKGPLFVVYPYDSRPELKHQRFYARSAWQVAKLIVT